MLERRDRAVLSEATVMAGGELAGIEHRRAQALLGDPGLHAPANEPRVKRVVVRIETQIRIRRDTRHPAPVEIGLLG